MSRHLKPELVTVLNLDRFENIPLEAVLVALESAQTELCLDTEFEPGQVYSIENTILQCYNLPDRMQNVNEQQSLRLTHSLLHYTAQTQLADRIVQFEYHSGHSSVTKTYEDCSVAVNDINVPCFSIATLYLNDLVLLTVIFARLA